MRAEHAWDRPLVPHPWHVVVLLLVVVVHVAMRVRLTIRIEQHLAKDPLDGGVVAPQAGQVPRWRWTRVTTGRIGGRSMWS